jgi:Putative cyclase
MSAVIDALRGARAYDLEQPRFAGAPVFPAHEPGLLVHLHRRHEPDAEEARTSASALLVMTEHSGTHIDALCHQAYGGRLHGGLPVSARVQTSVGFTALGIDTVPPLVARGVLLDVAGALGVERLEPGYAVSAAELERAAAGVELRPGAVCATAPRGPARGDAAHVLWRTRRSRTALRKPMNRQMARRAPIVAALACAATLAAGFAHHRAVAAPPPRTTPTWAGVAPAEQAWVRASIAAARPEAATLIRHAIGRVTFRTAYEPRAAWVGLTIVHGDDYTVLLNLSYLNSRRGVGMRNDTVLHELGHVVDFAEVPDDLVDRLAAEVPVSGTCLTPDTGDCTSPRERFADTFAKWALRGAVSVTGAGYSIPMPASLEDWGAPLGTLAAQLQAASSS